LGLFFVAPLIVKPIFGASFAGAVPIIRLMAIIPLLLNISACTANLYMFNYGHERAWSLLVLSSLVVFVGVAYGLLMWMPSAVAAVSLAVITKEAIVAAVSAGFLIMYGLRACLAAPADHAEQRSWRQGNVMFPAILRAIRDRIPSAG
jgi:PST family polysaccharide transporter